MIYKLHTIKKKVTTHKTDGEYRCSERVVVPVPLLKTQVINHEGEKDRIVIKSPWSFVT